MESWLMWLHKILTRLGILLTPEDLPLPFFKVLEEELAQLELGSPAVVAERSLQSKWGFSAVDSDSDCNCEVIDWEELVFRWNCLEMDKLVEAVEKDASRTLVSSGIDYLKDLKTACQNARPFARFVRRMSSRAKEQDAPETSTHADNEIGANRDTILKGLNTLVKAERCLYSYPHFPANLITRPTKTLIRSFLRKRKKTTESAGSTNGAEELAELNRLVLEDLFPEQLKKAYVKNLRAVYDRIQSAPTALCLSGGGIRSATFALGVLQGLARRGVLKGFDYLSTVSGGGYIGSWLTTWMNNQGNDTATVYEDLKGQKPDVLSLREPAEIRHLRTYSNYLAPKAGLFSADTWVLIATYLRNLFLNWLVFIPILLAACTIPRLYVSLLRTHGGEGRIGVCLWAGLALITWAVAYASVMRPGTIISHDNVQRTHRAKIREILRLEGQGGFLWFCLAPLVAGALFLTTFWIWYYRGDTAFHSWLIIWTPTHGPDVRNYLFLGTGVHLLAWVIAQQWLFLRTKLLVNARPPAVEFVTGAMGGLFLWGLARGVYSSIPSGWTYSLFWFRFPILAVPLFLLIFLVTGCFLVGLSSYRTSDEDREWWSRMGAWVLLVIVAWVVGTTVVLLGPLMFFWGGKVIGAAGGVSGLVSLLYAYSGKTAATQGAEREKKSSSGSKAQLMLSVGAIFFLLSFTALLSLIVGWLLYQAVRSASDLGSFAQFMIGGTNFTGLFPWNEPGYLGIIQHTRWILALRLLALLVLTGLLMSVLINLNEFSLHSVYRNRLIRAYLGASNRKRRPNRFTGFDPNDNPPMAELRSDAVKAQKPKTQKPLHIINMALNLVSGKDLAWQQRKADTFTASKFHCGNFRLGYRPSGSYAGRVNRTGLMLGTAMTVSGAAANSNMGSHSEPLLCFLLTLFNIRLGRWLGNPGPAGQNTFRDPTPNLWARYVAKEAFGLSDSESPFVFLSDGGHFENLGLYEMILRRCKIIIVCDGGCDPDCSLDDLGNAIRKVRVDLGVRIDIKKFGIYSRNDKRYDNLELEEIGKYCAIGDIYYKPDSVDGKGKPDGILIYLKPAICGKEPKDVFNYKERSPAFPHESTVDQFFDESQFESHRALGIQVIDRIYDGQEQADPDAFKNFVLLSQRYAKGGAAFFQMVEQSKRSLDDYLEDQNAPSGAKRKEFTEALRFLVECEEDDAVSRFWKRLDLIYNEPKRLPATKSQRLRDIIDDVNTLQPALTSEHWDTIEEAHDKAKNLYTADLRKSGGPARGI